MNYRPMEQDHQEFDVKEFGYMYSWDIKDLNDQQITALQVYIENYFKTTGGMAEESEIDNFFNCVGCQDFVAFLREGEKSPEEIGSRMKADMEAYKAEMEEEQQRAQKRQERQENEGDALMKQYFGTTLDELADRLIRENPRPPKMSTRDHASEITIDFQMLFTGLGLRLERLVQSKLEQG